LYATTYTSGKRRAKRIEIEGPFLVFWIWGEEERIDWEYPLGKVEEGRSLIYS